MVLSQLSKKSHWMLAIATVFFGSLAPAHKAKDGLIYGMAGPMLVGTHAYRQPVSYPFQPGFGLVAEADVDDRGGLEITIQYMRKIYSVYKDNAVYAEHAPRIYITTGYRGWFTPSFSVGIGFFSSYSMGNPELYRQDATERFSTSAYDATDYGFDFSIQAEPWQKERWSAVVHTAYSLSITPKESEAMNHFSIIVGLKYLIQSRSRISEKAK